MKLRLGIAVIVASVLLGSACSSDDSEDGTAAAADGSGASSEEEAVTIGYSMAIATDPANRDSGLGMECALGEIGGELISTDADLDLNKQLSDIENLVIQQPDVLVAGTLDPSSVGPALDRAAEAGIPVIELFNPESTQAGSVIADLDTYGGPIAAAVEERFPDGAEVLLHTASYPAAVAQTESITTALEELDGIEVVETISVDNPQVEAASAAFGDALTRHPDVDVIIGLDDTIAIGASIAASDKGMDVSEMEIIGANGKPDGIQAVEDGVLSATYALDVFAMGQDVVALAQRLAAGGDDEQILVEYERIDASNVESVVPADERCGEG